MIYLFLVIVGKVGLKLLSKKAKRELNKHERRHKVSFFRPSIVVVSLLHEISSMTEFFIIMYFSTPL